MKIDTRFTHLECSHCGATYPKDRAQTFCTTNDCNNPLVAAYDLSNPPSKEVLAGRDNTMWRYKEMLPVEEENNIVCLGEGMTPLLHVARLGGKLGMANVWMKDEGINPTGSFKARGLAMAVSKAKEYGIKSCSIPTAGNAGSALSAYCAKAGMEAVVYMPIKTPEVFQVDCQVVGARVTKVDGTIADAGKQMKAENTDGQWFDVSTLKEPYRIEGKKTMGYEIAEQMAWETPDVIVYPTGGGTGLIGIWKAFQEMQAMGWIDPVKTRMVAVQVEGCNPMVQAFEAGKDAAEVYPNPKETIANGLRVPAAFGHRLILKTLYESKGTAVTISDAEMLNGIKEIATTEGLFVSPEGAAVWEALKKLQAKGWVQPNERVVLLNTGSAYKYIENIV
jgi:threonine synthase